MVFRVGLVLLQIGKSGKVSPIKLGLGHFEPTTFCIGGETKILFATEPKLIDN
jgi:hypothetical protein